MGVYVDICHTLMPSQRTMLSSYEEVPWSLVKSWFLLGWGFHHPSHASSHHRILFPLWCCFIAARGSVKERTSRISWSGAMIMGEWVQNLMVWQKREQRAVAGVSCADFFPACEDPSLCVAWTHDRTLLVYFIWFQGVEYFCVIYQKRSSNQGW